MTSLEQFIEAAGEARKVMAELDETTLNYYRLTGFVATAERMNGGPFALTSLPNPVWLALHALAEARRLSWEANGDVFSMNLRLTDGRTVYLHDMTDEEIIEESGEVSRGR